MESKSGPETRSSDYTVCGARAVNKRGGRTRVTAGAGSGREEARRPELVQATRGKSWNLDDSESNRNGASDVSGRLHDWGDMHSRMRQHNCFELGGHGRACTDSERLVTSSFLRRGRLHPSDERRSSERASQIKEQICVRSRSRLIRGGWS